jgi:hypothetical protein
MRAVTVNIRPEGKEEPTLKLRVDFVRNEVRQLHTIKGHDLPTDKTFVIDPNWPVED